MAGDWIKFEVITSDKPEVYVIAAELGIDPDAVVGKLLRVWAWFDSHSIDGNAPSVTKALLDRITGVSGFCMSLVHSGWMVDDGITISLPNFTRHNGETAKKRALTSKRVQAHRGKCNAPSVTKALPEKRREDINTPPQGGPVDNFRQPIGEDFKPDNNTIEYCKTRQLPDAEDQDSIDEFINTNQSSGWKSANWQSEYRRYLAKKRGQEHGTAAGSRNHGEKFMAALRDTGGG